MTQYDTFVIAEAGSNWRMGTYERDIKMAKVLIDVAVDAQADAVKFQTYRPETVYVSNAGNSDYLSEAGIKESINEIFKDLSMPYEMIPILSDYCNLRGIEFMSTPFSINDAKAIDPFVKRHKIASYEISHSRLIEFVAKTGKPLILSTGASSYEDIDWAVEYFKKHGGTDLSLMQVTAKYPAPISSLNLSVIPILKEKYRLEIGLSDHSRDPIIGPSVAVALGASIVEKHFTLDNSLPGPDHSFALLPDELKIMVQSIRAARQSLGTGKKNVQDIEKELYFYAQRRLQAKENIKKGEIFEEGGNIDILRPGKQRRGIHPKFLSKLIGKPSKRQIPIGDGIFMTDF